MFNLQRGKYFFKYLYTTIKYHPKGKLVHWILRQKVITLVILFVLIYLTIALVFSVSYKAVGGIWDSTSEKITRNFGDCLYFSLTTQSTLGYGDLYPKGYARLLSTIQTIAGILISTFILGVILVRVIRRAPRIVYTEEIAYDKNNHELVLSFWNRDADNLFNVDVSVLLRREISTEKHPFLVIRNHPLLLWKTRHPYISSMSTFIIRTSSEGIDVKSPQILNLNSNAVSILTIDKSDEIIVTISGISVDSGVPIIARKLYLFNNIKCGYFHHVFPEGRDVQNWHYRDYNKFGMLEKTSVEECKKCEIAKDCPLI